MHQITNRQYDVPRWPPRTEQRPLLLNHGASRNEGRGRHRGRKKRSRHEHVHFHRTTVVHQPAPETQLVAPKWKSTINAQRIHAPSTVQTFSPTVLASQVTAPGAAPLQMPQQKDDGFAGFVVGILTALIAGAALLSSNGSSGSKRQ